MRRVVSLLALVATAVPSAAFAQQTDPNAAAGANTTAGAAQQSATSPTATPAAGTTEAQGSAATAATTTTTLPEVPPAAASSTTEPATSTTPAPAQIRPTPAPVDLDRRALPVVEVHGFLRTRFEMFHDFTLGWDRVPGPGGVGRIYDDGIFRGSGIPWVRNPDNFSGWCNGVMGTDGVFTANPASPCANGTQVMANMRFRFEPEIHPVDWVVIRSQIDVLDNLVMGSTPEGGYTAGFRSPFAPNQFLSNTQVSPQVGLNTLTDSILVKRAWAEATNSTLGTLRFGRMPWHWGLGMLQNAGNDTDADYQTTVDRIGYQGRYRPYNLFFGAAWDFMSSGVTSQRRAIDAGQGQTYDLSMYDNVHQVVAYAGRQLDIDDQRAAVARNEVVFNAGGYVSYRWQFLSGEGVQTDRATRAGGSMIDAIEAGTLNGSSQTYGEGLARRDAWQLTTDGWFQILGKIFRVEGELAYTRGWMYSAANNAASARNGYFISQFGALLEAELRPIPRLRIELKMGYASGDAETEGLSYSNGVAQFNDDRILTNFAFHPNQRIDLIFWRNIQRQVSGAYFFRPSAQYDFISDPEGNRFFGRVDVIWSRAAEWISTRGNRADLGIEIDATLRYESNHRRDPNDRRPLPGFFALAQYGVFFPLAGLGARDDERNNSSSTLRTLELLPAQTVRGVLGVTY
jgi:uncharacterized protein (TIGR04551 family)